MKKQTIVLLLFLIGVSLNLTGQITHIGNFDYTYYSQDIVLSPGDSIIYSLQSDGSTFWKGTNIDRLYLNNTTGLIDNMNSINVEGILRRINRTEDGAHYYALDQRGKIICFTPDLVELSIFNDTISELWVNGDIEITKKGDHVYLPCSNGIYILNRDSTSGNLSFNSFIKDDTLENNNISDLRGLKISNNDKFIYTISYQDSAINVFLRDTITGHLNRIQTLTEFDNGKPLVFPKHMDLSPKNDFIVISISGETDGAIVAFSIDTLSGFLSYDTCLVGSFANDVTDIEISNDNTYFFVTEISNKKLHVFRKDNIIHNSMRYIGEVQKFEKDAFTYDWDGPRLIRISSDMKNIYVSQKYANTQLNYFRIYNFGLPVDIDSDLLGCNGDSININATENNYVSYIWDDGSTNSFRYVNEDGDYSVRVTDEFGRIGIDTVHVGFITVVANISGEDRICLGDSATLTAMGGDTYLWNNGFSDSLIKIFPEHDTTIIVTAMIDNCNDTDTFNIQVLTLPIIALSNDTSICLGDTVILYASGGSNYLWENSATDSIITVVPNVTTQYFVSVSDSTCSRTDSVSVIVHPLPQMTLGEDLNIENDTIVMIYSDSGFESYLWSNNSTEDFFQFDASILDIGEYFVWLEVKNDHGCKVSDTISVTVVEATNTGLNDYFTGEKRLKVFPNPNKGSFEIYVPLTGQISVKLVDFSGKIVTEFKVNNDDLHGKLVFSNIKVGLYFIQVSNEKEEYSSKILVQ